MRDYKEKAFAIVVAFGVLLLIGSFISMKPISKGGSTPENILPPSPYRLQEMLNEYEPENPIKVDGKIGKETIEKWYRISNNIDAGRTFNP